MNLSIIIHALIIIFILHIILINIDFSITLGPPISKSIEKMTNQREFSIVEKDKENESLDFLLGKNNKKDDLFKKKMSDYIKDIKIEKKEVREFDEKNEFPVLPANNYLENESRPNFESNVADTNKFYEINKLPNKKSNFDNLDENDLKSTSLQTLGISDASKPIFNERENISTTVNVDSNTVRQSTVNPDNWKYKNEFPMNGGNMNGIVGFDGIDSQYADFGSFFQVEDNTKQPVEKLPHDDLRKPVVYNN